ncbi:hypothetical protein ATO12_14980 [Aquimarina atlantica]|uniref:Methyltransferase domain-containing protein n=1 Tax=Aquimarina atlantica TaxID=1317122 RepID=A0A023BVZ1_9FLAO|nr:class I SAM-dependent methyltransferase [Aquimarina atlantica]EZH74171.1 hypothetical protein ATO12_14980 [Aquimarina atlantica]
MKSIGNDITERLIETGKLKPGMRVLDLGCGNGNVSFIVSKFVGQHGIVVGLDNNKNAINAAKQKANELELSNMKFIELDITKNFEIEYSKFDVIIVRRVLMYLSNPIKTIRNAITHLKPNGLFLVQENDMSLVPIGLEGMPIHQKIIGLIKKTLAKENANLNFGFELNTILTNSGLKVEKIWAEATVSTPSQLTPWSFLANVMKERMLKHEVIKNLSELNLDSLEERLTEERLSNTKTFISDIVFCGVARKLSI